MKHSVDICIIHQKHMHQQAYMQPAHVGPTQARMATAARVQLLLRR